MFLKKYYKLKKEITELKDEVDFLNKTINNLQSSAKYDKNRIENMHEMLCKVVSLAYKLENSETKAQIITAANFGLHYSKNMEQFQTPPKDIENCYKYAEGGHIADCRKWRGFLNCEELEDCPKKNRKEGKSANHD